MTFLIVLFLSQLVDTIHGVIIQCQPPKLAVTLTNDGDHHTHQWKLCLVYKVKEITYYK